ncbi:Peroxiredoxin-2E-2, chloroplastic [Senna tora]|uniref:Peroxiredoxin-2E-2, chloroplastic n=1 Tax=Senna tora TaxID=362788 RepID=A0A834ST88_9FABA|nr:Peroxiredoxin-2E-2, chloroplastic [Senna tora]
MDYGGRREKNPKSLTTRTSSKHFEQILCTTKREGTTFLQILNESGNVLLGTGWGEGTGNGEENGLLFLGEVGDGGGLELAGGIEVGKGGFGELITDGDGGGRRS